MRFFIVLFTMVIQKNFFIFWFQMVNKKPDFRIYIVRGFLMTKLVSTAPLSPKVHTG